MRPITAIYFAQVLGVTSIQLIGFSDGCPANDGCGDESNRITASLAAHGFRAGRVGSIAELQPDVAAFVSGDSAGWLETVREIRAMYPRIFLVVVTRIPDSAKWLDALEAGANDYCSRPLDRQQVGWLLQPLDKSRAAWA